MKNKQIATLIENQELNGIELYFESIPTEEERNTLKANGFRWNRAKKCWYAKDTADTRKAASIFSDPNSTATAAPAVAKKAPAAINLDNLGQNRPCLYGAELSKAIRDELKRRGATGCTVRNRYHDAYTVTIKATAEDFASVEEMKERYTQSAFYCDLARNNGLYMNGRYIYESDYEAADEAGKDALHTEYVIYSAKRLSNVNWHHFDREYYWEFTEAFYNKVQAVIRIANQWNYDNSDIMTDYFDVGYYLDIDIKKPEDFEPRHEMTEAERTAYAEEVKRNEEERAEALRKYEEERKAAEERAKAYEEKRKADREIILNDITIEDLNEEQQIYITNLVGGIGKESTLKELDETLSDYDRPLEDALITRKVTFSSREAFELFGQYLIDDFDFLAGKGGTGSEDVRLEGLKNLYNLTTEQRESVKWYLVDSVAIYVEDELMLVSDPEGYTYSRYTYRPTAETEILNAKQETKKQENESKSLDPFYFPEALDEQIKNIATGQSITIYQTDGWMLNNVYGGSGTVEAITPGTWAQHNGYYITLSSGKKRKDVFIRDRHDMLIYDGIRPLLPDSITRRKISDKMYELLNYDELFRNILKYYEDKPLIDTIQR